MGQAGRRLQFELLEPRRVLAAANLIINEFMATNDNFHLDGDGNASDWIEVRNLSAATVNLGDYFLTDSDGNLQKWALPVVNLAAGQRRLFYASAPLNSMGEVIDNYIDGGGIYHTNFKLDSEGEYLALTYEDPVTHVVSVVHEYGPEFPEQFPNVSYGIASGGTVRYFDAPTPGTNNGAGLLGVVEDTKFSADRGFYTAPIQVTITTDTPAATIYYTTDGSAPSPSNGTAYTGPVTISQTTPLRAIAVKSGYLSTNVDTQTYLFLNDIVRQTAQSALDAGYPSVWMADNGNFTADYGFDPDVIGTFDVNGNPLGGDLFGGIYADRLKDNLLAIPTISIVLDPDDMFGQDVGEVEGIYIDPRQNRNPEPERATSIEWIMPDGSTGFQVDAGIQMQGGAFRSHFLTRKHSFRLVFKDEYGPSELAFPLFGEDAVDEFNTIVLRGTANDGYSWSAGQQTLQYARDQFGHSLQRAMGYATPADTYAHLYVNGMYWGLYSPTERPDNEFAASYLGINPDNWDAIHDNEAQSGDFVAWNQMFAQAALAGSSLAEFMKLQGLNANGTPNPAYAPLLDVQNYIDYMIINVWGGNDDWPHHNFWAGRDRSPETTEGFQFFLWDFDGVMGNSREWSPLDTKTFDQTFTGQFNVGQPHRYLETNPEYQLMFADRVHEYFFNDGLLVPDNLVERYQAIVEQVEQVIVAESARWGDNHSAVPLTLTEWTTERDWLLNTYLPERSAIVMDEMREYGFYPDTDAPQFNQYGGEVPNGFDLTIMNPNATGSIYYTLDGSDPRLPGGNLSSAAIPYTGAIDVTAGVQVKARVFNPTMPGTADDWSPLVNKTFTLEESFPLRIVELHYNPAGSAEVTEFIELMNYASQTISLDGVQIGGFASTPYSFQSGQTLGAGGRIVVARNPSDFILAYGSGINLATGPGYAEQNLSNGGELITLLGPVGELLQSFAFGDSGAAGWPDSPDGEGPSLEYIGPLTGTENPSLGSPLDPFDDPANWQASANNGGSPGTSGVVLPDDADFNEDDEISGLDFLAWQINFGITTGATTAQGDANHDGAVDGEDLAIWNSQYGTSGGELIAIQSLYSTSAPESALSAELIDLAIAVNAPKLSSSKQLVEIDPEWVFDDYDPISSTLPTAPAAPSPSVGDPESVENSENPLAAPTRTATESSLGKLLEPEFDA